MSLYICPNAPSAQHREGSLTWSERAEASVWVRHSGGDVGDGQATPVGQWGYMGNL